MRAAVILCVLALVSSATVAAEVKISGQLSPQIRVFPDGSGSGGRDAGVVNPSFAGEVKMEASGFPKRFRLTVNPYYRHDSVDPGRSVFDVHALKIAVGGERWHVKAGYDVEFWGVMEVVNPVNIINQTDVTEDFLGKRKLGQPMVDVTILGKWGTLDLYALGRFQPMQFPAGPGRLAPPIPVRPDETRYDSGNGGSPLEGAVRYFRNIGNTYIGVSHFAGYAREPDMLLSIGAGGTPFLVPSYTRERQTGLELQVTLGDLILKSEDVLRRDVHGNQSTGISVGGEYDLGPVMKARHTISVFGEYYHDGRARSLVIPFRDDVFGGVRLGIADRRSMELRVWGNYDRAAGRCDVVMVDASARVSERIKTSLAYRGVLTGKDAFGSFAHDSHLIAKIEAFF